MKKIVTHLKVPAALLFFSLSFTSHILAQSKVILAGSFQSELGCSGDWLPDCDNTALTYNSSTGLWTGSFNIPAGCQQYKVTTDGSWDINYGENGLQNGSNITLYVPVETLITFTYNPTTHIVETSPVASGFSTSCLPQVVLAGSFQDTLGCSSDWDANCSNTALTYVAATGQFENDLNIPPGYYEFRVVLNNDWVNNFGIDGHYYDPNYSIYIPCKTTTVHFSYNPLTHIVTSTYNFHPNTVVIAGSFQSELGCPGDWQPDCDNTRMQYDPVSGTWVDTLYIPAGHWEYKITLNNSWTENYGLYGEPSGPNIPLDLCSPAKVIFNYYDCYHYAYTQIIPDQPNTVVVSGSFQSELGCASDWQPDCDNTRMQYDPLSGTWIDTLYIPAGHWEYKWTINNSWDENYGLYGESNGPAISLDLCYPAKVAFKFNHNNCSGYGYGQIITNGVCLNKFYDGNVNGFPDPGEEPMAGVTFTLTGNGIAQTQTTDNDGKAAFSNLPDGIYVVKENVPSGYYSSQIDSQYVYLFSSNATVYFGNVCIGSGGAKGVGFWTSKNGETALINSGKMEDALWWLRYWGLRNADGTDFEPYTYAQLRTWMMGANAKNMTYMLSAQLAAMFLSTELGYVDSYNSYIYTPGCAWWGNFMNVSNLIWYTNYYLWYNTTVDGKNPERGYLDCLKNAFDNANNNLTFAQPHPCSGAIPSVNNKQIPEVNEIVRSAEARLWPNPSSSYFTLRPANSANNEPVLLKVFNANGQQVYTATGSSDKDYRFGERFKTGIYFVELTQGNNRTTFKLIKQ